MEPDTSGFSCDDRESRFVFQTYSKRMWTLLCPKYGLFFDGKQPRILLGRTRSNWRLP